MLSGAKSFDLADHVLAACRPYLGTVWRLLLCTHFTDANENPTKSKQRSNSEVLCSSNYEGPSTLLSSNSHNRYLYLEYLPTSPNLLKILKNSNAIY